MVADELAIVASSMVPMQISLTMAETNAKCERYTYNASKTKTVAINCSTAPILNLNDKPLGTSSKEVHVGIHRNDTNSNADTVEARVKSARRTAYSLMGAGMHGLNGIGPEIAALQYATYVLPTLIYGLETLTLNPNEIKSLSTYHRKNLRYIQHLPQSTALPAIFLLRGTAPIKKLLHIRALTLFRNIIAAESNTPPAIYIRDLITRQATVKDSTSSNWTTTIKKILQTYKLPSIVKLIENRPRKREWRKTVKKTINEAWTEALQDEA